MASKSGSLIGEDREPVQDFSCADALSFQTKLLKIRKFDDKIINILNSHLPTESFYSKDINPGNKCKQFRAELDQYYASRYDAIKKCIDQTKKEVDELKESGQNRSLLREKSYNLRYFQQEYEIENVYRDKTVKAVDERCRAYL